MLKGDAAGSEAYIGSLAFLPGLWARAKAQFRIIGRPPGYIRIDEASKGRHEALRIIWVPRGMHRRVGTERNVPLIRFLQFEEEARYKDRCDAA